MCGEKVCPNFNSLKCGRWDVSWESAVDGWGVIVSAEEVIDRTPTTRQDHHCNNDEVMPLLPTTITTVDTRSLVDDRK